MMSVPLPPVVLAGSLVILWGSLIVVIGMAESYDERKKWRQWLNTVGTLIIAIGTAVAFVGTAANGITNTDSTILTYGLAVLSLTAVTGLVAPRVIKRGRGESQAHQCQDRDAVVVASTAPDADPTP
jgi:preprotein translocase subunit SecY